MTTSLILAIAVAVLLLLVGIGLVGWMAARSAIARAHEPLKELCAENGWTFEEGARSGEAYRIEGPGFRVVSRTLRGAGPERENGLHTAFHSPFSGSDTTWVGPASDTPDTKGLLGEEVPLSRVQIGDDAFSTRFSVQSSGAAEAVSEPVRTALMGLDPAHHTRVVLHAPELSVILFGRVANRADVGALIEVGKQLAQI